MVSWLLKACLQVSLATRSYKADMLQAQPGNDIFIAMGVCGDFLQRLSMLNGDRGVFKPWGWTVQMTWGKTETHFLNCSSSILANGLRQRALR